MPTDLASLVEILRQHRLLDADQLAALPHLQAQHPEPRALAKELVRRGWLTPYQANRIISDEVKSLLLGPYVLLAKLGEGGMGQVFKARHQRLGRIDALKIIRKERLEKPEAIKRFYREIRAVAQLRHPNIVHAYDADEVSGTHFFSMEYVDGEDLGAVVKKHGPLPVAQACDYIRQASLGLQHAYEKGLVHRDIKPHNLLVSGGPPKADTTAQPACAHAPGTVKILDMGLARIESGAADDKSSTTMTQEGTIMGTPDYIAPEQARSSHEVDIRADIYSLGCTFYYLLAGRPPFPGGSLTEKLLKHQLEEPAALEELRTDLPVEVAAIIRGMMAKSPNERFQTPADVAAALDITSGSASTAPATFAQIPLRTFPTASDEALATTPSGSGSATSSLVDHYRQRRLARQKAWEKKFFIGVGVIGFLLIFGLTAFLLRHFLGGPEEQPESEPTTQGPAKQPGGKSPDAKKPSGPEAQQHAAESRRIADAEAAFLALQVKFKAPGVTFASFSKAVAAFRAQHGGTPAAIRAAELLMKLPSPLDKLDPTKIPDDAKVAWRKTGRSPPAELVGVLGEHRRRLNGPVRAIMYSPDGKWLASSDGANVLILDAKTLTEHARLATEPGGASSMAFSSDGGTFAAIGGGRQVRLWEVQTGMELRTKEPILGESVAFSPNGLKLAIGNGGQVQIWDWAKGIRERVFLGIQHSALPAFSQDGQWVFAVDANHAGRKAFVWEVVSGEVKRELELPNGGGQWAEFGPDGRRVASFVDVNHMNLWDWERSEKAQIHTGAFACRFLPDGRCVLFTVQDGKGRFHELDSKEELAKFSFDIPAMNCAAIATDLSRVAVGLADGSVRLWDADTGKEVQPLSGPVGRCISVAFSPDELRFYATSDDSAIRVWNLTTLKEERLIPAPAGKALATFAHLSPDGRHLLSAYYQTNGNDPIVLRDAATGVERQRLAGRVADPTAAAFSPDSRQFLIPDQSGAILRCESEGGKELGRANVHTEFVTGVAYTPDGRLAFSGSIDRTAKLWEVERGKVLQQFDHPDVPVTGVAVAPNGIDAYTGTVTGVVRRWDLKNARDPGVAFPDGHTGQVHALTVSPDGKRLATCSADGRVILWDTVTQLKFRDWQFLCPVHGLAFSADGRHLATANANGTVYILRIPASDVNAAAATEAFTPLFNGKDLTGWKTHPDNDGQWRVQNGLLTCTGKRGILFSERADYRDFTLRVELRIRARSDSGLFLRVPFAGAGTGGYEVMIDPSDTDQRILTRWQGAPEIWRSPQMFPAGQWSILAVTAQGPRVTIKLNDETLTSIEDPSPALTPGHIAVQHESERTQVHFRKIEIQELPTSLRSSEAGEFQKIEARRLGVPFELTNSIGMKLRLIPAGQFRMGSPPTELGRRDNEGPQHSVRISQPYYFAVHEVTEEQFETVMKRTVLTGPQHPAHSVSWQDAKSFCEKLSAMEPERQAGRRYRLPTEAEWEYACRAGTQTAFSFGDDPTELSKHAWFNQNDGGQTHPVGELSPNPWGLFDMHGNLWEFCSDFYESGYYRNSPALDPQGPASGAYCVIRGGARGNPLTEARSACRWPNHPPGPHGNVGFRVVSEVRLP
jgi:serine/threonine-protein kinase